LAHILRAFAKGADGVFVGGCRLGECNYITHGNYHAQNLVMLAKRILEHIGLNPARLHIAFMSGGEGNLFASVSDEFCKNIRELGPIGQGNEIGREKLVEAVAEIDRLIPYIKIEKRSKLTARLTEANPENHFTLQEVQQMLDGAVSYYIDPEKCQACMLCAKSCPVAAIEGGKNLVHVIDQDRCLKCGTCLTACPSRFGAVEKLADRPVPPPLPVEKRKIVRKTAKEKSFATEKALP